MRYFKIVAIGLMAMMAVSCVTQKQMTYMRDADAAKADSLNPQFVSQTEAIIRNGDALTVFISALDKEAVTPYNLPTVVYAMPGTNSVQTTPMLQYYVVDEEGNIELPVLGPIHVAGLKRTEVAQAIKARLEAQVLNPLVQVELVSVLAQEENL